MIFNTEAQRKDQTMKHLLNVRFACALAIFSLVASALQAEVACSFEGATMNVVAPSTHAGRKRTSVVRRHRAA